MNTHKRTVNEWFEFNPDKKDYYDKIDSDKKINPLTGHHANHQTHRMKKITSADNLIRCKFCRVIGTRFAKQAKIVKNNDMFYSLCITCWKRTCQSQKWDNNLSYRANEICDAMEMSFIERKKIDQFNIASILSLPNHKQYTHVSDLRRKEGLKKKEWKDAKIDIEKYEFSNSLSSENDDDDDYNISNEENDPNDFIINTNDDNYNISNEENDSNDFIINTNEDDYNISNKENDNNGNDLIGGADDDDDSSDSIEIIISRKKNDTSSSDSSDSIEIINNNYVISNENNDADHAIEIIDEEEWNIDLNADYISSGSETF